ncbi:6536_t:CDS:2 [Acaulospora colombiana]|uniref:6536_t:CDS:1 n=1 Tax=Acaulospora colombiana TaxID=27376 RepID=A0ACA9LHT8_9GLOM|nr:6536_t:CDS:2 [Acaulospora colombiana]
MSQQNQGQQQQQPYPTPLSIPSTNLNVTAVNASGNSPASATPLSGLQNPYNLYSQYAMMNMGLGGMGMMGLNYPFSPTSFPQTPANAAASLQAAAAAAFNAQNNQTRNGGGNPNNPISPLNVGAAQAYALQAAAAAGAANQAASRTVYMGNLPQSAAVDELLNLIKFGPIENVRILGEKSCAFISFLDPQTAAAFHTDATLKKISLHGAELKIGWGKPSPVPPQVLLAVQQNNATRNVYLGGLDESTTEAMLRDDLSRFGLIDQIKIVKDKGIGFVHFLSIAVAQKVVATLPTEPAWQGKRVNYGKDRCAFQPKTTQAAQAAVQVAAQSLAAAAGSPMTGVGFGFGGFGGYDLASPIPTTPASAMALMAAVNGGMSPGGAAGMMNRTVYLGNIHPETSTEDLCNAIRGGVLQSIKYMTDKHIAFITFIDPAAAFTFYQVATYQGLTLNNRRLKVGWGKTSGPLTPALALAVHSGATRNVYIGGIEDFELFNEERLKRDFLEFGEIELVNYLKEKNCAFVNFTNIANAIKAIEGIKTKPEYATLRIAHGKDRCANPPRTTGAANPSSGPLSAGLNGPKKMSGPTISITGSGLSPTLPDDGETVNEAEVAALAAVVEQELQAEGASLG